MKRRKSNEPRTETDFLIDKATAFRKQKYPSQEQFAKVLFKDRSVISKFEHSSDMDLSTFVEYTKALGLRIYLIDVEQ